MKAGQLIVLLFLVFTPQVWSQTPTPKPDQEYIVIAGDVRPQSLVPYSPGMKLMEAVTAAGDIDFAERLAIVLIRCGKKKIIKIKHLKGSPSEPVLEPWDIIYFPPSVF